MSGKSSVIPAIFQYEKPESVGEALSCLARLGPEAQVLAGGQSLLPQLKGRTVTPRLLVDISGIGSLQQIALDGKQVTIGAMTTQAQLSCHQEIRRLFPVFASDAFRHSDPLVRNCGTFAGALAHADPASDWTAIALMLGAEVHLSGANGPRTILANAFFMDSFATACEPYELITHVTIPIRHQATGMAYLKLPHPASGFALVGVAAAIERDREGWCAQCRVAVTGAGRKAYRAAAVERALQGQRLSSDLIAEAADLAVEGVEIIGDLAGGPEYRGLLVRTYVKRALLAATFPTVH
jgi:aerobic carbon-monoxide dehydrogenase medium subunit